MEKILVKVGLKKMILICLFVVLSMLYWIGAALTNNTDWQEFKKDWW